MTIKQLAIAERRAAKRARREIELALENLPAPQFEYEIANPDVMTKDDEVDRINHITEKDRVEVEAEEMERLRKVAEKLYEERSSVV